MCVCVCTLDVRVSATVSLSTKELQIIHLLILMEQIMYILSLFINYTA